MPNIADAYARFLASQYPNSKLAQQRRVTAFQNPTTGNVQLGPSGATNPNLTGPGGRDVGGGTPIMDPRNPGATVPGQRRGTARPIPRMPDMSVETPPREQMVGRRLAPPQTFMEKLQSLASSPYGRELSSGLGRGAMRSASTPGMAGFTGSVAEIVEGANRGAIAQTEADEKERLKAEATALQAQRAGMDLNELMADAMSRGDYQLVNAIANMLGATSPTGSTQNLPGSLQEVGALYKQQLLVQKMQAEVEAGTRDADDPELANAKMLLSNLDARINRQQQEVRPNMTNQNRLSIEGQARLEDPNWILGMTLPPGAQQLAMMLGVGQSGQNAYNRGMATEVIDWERVGKPAVMQRIQSIRYIAETLEGRDDITGPWLGLLPDAVMAVLAPEAANIQDAVREIVYEGLRETLGAQFTENEGKRLVSASFNTSLDERMNLRRMNRMAQIVQDSTVIKELQAQYFQLSGGQMLGFDNWMNDGNDPSGLKGKYLQSGYNLINDGLGMGVIDGLAMTTLGASLIEVSDYEGLTARQTLNAVKEDVKDLNSAERMALMTNLMNTGVDPEHPLAQELAKSMGD